MQCLQFLLQFLFCFIFPCMSLSKFCNHQYQMRICTSFPCSHISFPLFISPFEYCFPILGSFCRISNWLIYICSMFRFTQSHLTCLNAKCNVSQIFIQNQMRNRWSSLTITTNFKLYMVNIHVFNDISKLHYFQYPLQGCFTPTCICINHPCI